MDIQRKAFEAEFRKTDFYKMNLVNCFCFINDRYVWDEVQAAWEMWQAAKAQAVPNLRDLQERIGGHQYYHDEHGHMIVDMDDVVKEISGFDGWKAQAVPEGFVLAPVEEVKTWYLDDDESIYREDPDWLCNTPVGEVVEVERRISYELDQAPVFAAITWDEDNQDIGYYETFATKDEAEKAAAHCKAMQEAQEQKG